MPLDNHFYYKKDRLNQLRGFCATVKCCCSQIKASKELNVEPATVNKQISSLERDLKVKLFDRTNPQRLTLTNEGQMFYDEILPSIQKIDSVFETFYDGLMNRRSNEIRIGAHHTIFYYLIPKYIEEFKKNVPESIFILKYGTAQECINELLNDKLDIVLYPIEHELSGCKTKLLYDLEPMILVNKNNRLANIRDKEISYKDLAIENLMMTDKAMLLPYFQKICEQFKFKTTIKFEDGDWEIMRNFVKMNLGVHLYSDLYNMFNEFKDPDIISKNVSHLFPNIRIHSIVKDGKIQNKITNDFLDMITTKF